MADTWNIVTALAAAGSGLAATYAVWQNSAQAKTRFMHEEAAVIRQEVNAYKISLDRIIRDLRSGEILLSVSETIVHRFQRHYSINDVEQLHSAMDSLNQRISLVTLWIAEDVVAKGFKKTRLTLQEVSSNLAVRLPIFSYTTDWVDQIISQSLTSTFFLQFFTKELRSAMLRDLHPAAKPGDIDDLIGREVSSNAASYFRIRFLEAVNSIEKFVDILTRKCLSLSENQIWNLEMSLKTAVSNKSYPENIYECLISTQSFFGEDTTNELLKKSEEIRKLMEK